MAEEIMRNLDNNELDLENTVAFGEEQEIDEDMEIMEAEEAPVIDEAEKIAEVDEIIDLDEISEDAEADEIDENAESEEEAGESAKELEESEEPEEESDASPAIEKLRSALEAARDEENSAYHALRKLAPTENQKNAMELMRFKELESLDRDQAEEKCIMLLRNFYLPRVTKDGVTVKLADAFTRFEEPERDYIEAVFTSSTGKKRTVGYNYKFDSDGRSLILFEKTFENKILEPGEPEKYVLYDKDGETEIASFSTEDLKDMVAGQEVVKVDGKFYRKAKDEDGNVIEGVKDVFTKEGFENGRRTVFGDNEQEVYSLSKSGQLLKAVSNDVKSVYVEKMVLPRSEAVYWNEQEARAAAESMLQENDTNRSIEIFAEGTSKAKFNFVPVFTTLIDLNGTTRKIGKGLGDYDPDLPDEENVKNQMARLITDYLNEKGYHVLNIKTENIQAAVKESVGWMNTIKTYQMSAGTCSITYLKVYKTSVTLKQGFLHGSQTGNVDAILAQLPAGSELLNPEAIDWKSSKPNVTYYLRADATASGSGKTVELADAAAMDNTILEAQRIAARGLNGGIASGMRETIAANGAVSTVTNVRKTLNVPTVTKEDMEITREIAKYAFGGTFEREVTSESNQLISVTTWDVDPLTYVEPTDPIVEKGIPADDNYDRYVNEDDDSGILLFEKTDIEFRRFMQDAVSAHELSKMLTEQYASARKTLAEAQEAFDQAYDSI